MVRPVLTRVAGIRAVSGPIPPMVKNEPGLAGCVGGHGNAAVCYNDNLENQHAVAGWIKGD